MPDLPDPGSALLAPSVELEPLVCPSCGAEVPRPTDVPPDAAVATLLAVCDVLVVKALEKMGWYLIRADRSRFWQIEQAGLPQHAAHTLWRTTDDIVTKATKGAWDVVPLVLETHGPTPLNAAVAIETLNEYVHDLVVSGEPHDLNALAFRLRRDVELPVFHIRHPDPRTGDKDDAPEA